MTCVVERWNKTIKTDMWKYFTANNSYKYIDILPALVEKYNNSYHHSIKCTPIEAQKLANREMIFTNLYGKKTLPVCKTFVYLIDYFDARFSSGVVHNLHSQRVGREGFLKCLHK